MPKCHPKNAPLSGMGDCSRVRTLGERSSRDMGAAPLPGVGRFGVPAGQGDGGSWQCLGWAAGQGRRRASAPNYVQRRKPCPQEGMAVVGYANITEGRTGQRQAAALCRKHSRGGELTLDCCARLWNDKRRQGGAEGCHPRGCTALAPCTFEAVRSGEKQGDEASLGAPAAACSSTTYKGEQAGIAWKQSRRAKQT